jgi:hypothetical protein
LLSCAFPIPGQQLVDLLGRMILQSCEDIGEPGLRVDVVELCGLDQRVDSSGAAAAFVGAGERPVVSADRNKVGTLVKKGTLTYETRCRAAPARRRCSTCTGRPSSRKRMSEVQRLRLYWIALAISFVGMCGNAK